ncbi:hypothetical protein [Bradyrhizobium stylosanthis]|nr:hypothetical protein [Bradyrhizobium stylosanthis]
MPDPNKQTEGQEAKPSRLDEARRNLEEYAAELRDLLRKLQGKLH